MPCKPEKSSFSTIINTSKFQLDFTCFSIAYCQNLYLLKLGNLISHDETKIHKEQYRWALVGDQPSLKKRKAFVFAMIYEG